MCILNNLHLIPILHFTGFRCRLQWFKDILSSCVCHELHRGPPVGHHVPVPREVEIPVRARLFIHCLLILLTFSQSNNITTL